MNDARPWSTGKGQEDVCFFASAVWLRAHPQLTQPASRYTFTHHQLQPDTTPMHDTLVFAVDYSRILAGVLNLGADRLPLLLAGTRLNPVQFLEMEGYLSWADQHRIIANALQLAEKPGLGLLAGERYSLMTHGVAGVAAMASPTVLEALQALIRYQPTRAQFATIRLEQSGKQLILHIDITVEPDAVATFLLEALLVSLVSTLRYLIGDHVRELDVNLASAKPPYSERYEQRIPGTLRFGQPDNRLAFPAEYGQLRVPTHDANIQRWAVDQCEQQFQRLQSSVTFTSRILSILRQSHGQTLSQDQVAFMLNVSPRTLLRRLKDEGSTYKQLVDEEQKRLAQYYLEHTDLTAEAIAEQVGYHDLSSFRRAFKRWFGLLPSQYPR